jgi:poly(3-hydroxybutyrate) depolymerase
MSLNVAGLPVGSAVAGLLIVHSLPATFAAAAFVAALAAAAVALIPAADER